MQVNARKIHDEPNVLTGILNSPQFLAILAVELLLQIAIVQYGGRAFSTVPLNSLQWAACVGGGALTLLVGAGLRLLPTTATAARKGTN